MLQLNDFNGKRFKSHSTPFLYLILYHQFRQYKFLKWWQNSTCKVECLLDLPHRDNWRIKKSTRCHLLFYCTSYRFNMFRALLCPSSGARDYDVDYHIGRFVTVSWTRRPPIGVMIGVMQFWPPDD